MQNPPLNNEINQQEKLEPSEEKINGTTTHGNDNSSFLNVKTETSILIKDLLKSQDMLIEGSKLSPEFNSDYGRIKRPILSNAFGKSSTLVKLGNFVLVTSSIPGEGKTHTAINLALTIAQERDYSVLLIDSDVTRHGTSNCLDITNKPGLVELIEDDKLTINDVILKTDIQDLYIIPSGKQHTLATELLASQRMSEIIKEINEKFSNNLVILDGPPLLPTPQTQILCELVGQIVFIIEAGKTPQKIVEEALNLIPEGLATGLVMNKCEGMLSKGNHYYGYYNDNTLT